MERNYKYYIVMIFVITMSSLVRLYAQDNTRVLGTIKESNSENTVGFANVLILQSKDSSMLKGVMADGNGAFVFENIMKGSYLIKISFIGYQQFYSPSFVIQGDGKEVDLGKISLNTESKVLNEVKVVGNKPLVERQIDRFVLNVENSVVGAGSTSLEVLERAPGVLVGDNGSVSLQGKTTMIMVDGKQIQLSGEGLNNFLKSLKSDNIAKIELITQPSAKYDSFAGAVIDIKLKKGVNQGFNGNVNLGLSQSIYTKYTGGGNFNFKEGKFNFFANYNQSFNKSQRISWQDSRFPINSSLYSLYTDSKNESSSRSHSYKLGFDYNLAANHVLGLSVDGSIYGGDNEKYATTDFRKSVSLRDSTLETISTSTMKEDFRTYNLNYKGTLDSNGKELEINIDYGKDNYSSDALFLGRMRIPPQSEASNFRQGLRNRPSYITEFNTYKIDYTQAINQSLKMEAGAKSSFVTANNLILVDLQTKENGMWEPDTKRNDNFVYKENINAAYVTFAKSVGKWQIQTGLRVENTNIELNSYSTQSFTKKDYTNLFPNFLAETNLSENHQLAFAFRRDITRPSYDQMNPLTFYTDQYTYSQGNPNLNPSKSYNFSLTHTYAGKITTTFDYSVTNDMMYETTEQIPSTKVVRHFIGNLAKSTDYGLNVNFQVAITKWWQTSNNIYGSVGKVTDNNFLGNKLDIASSGYYFNSTHNIALPKGYKMDVYVNYLGQYIVATNTQLPRFYMNVSFQKSIWKKQGSLKLNLNDIFWSRQYTYRTLSATQNIEGSNYADTRLVRLTLTYKFGNKKLSTRQRNSGSDEVQSRINH
ncbi:outer membrane receptor protein involved in Fe transport [Arcicella aurantiaca]|uniref:Outer membrane receptor protein involved in Fe transport n=1 Tax=Arcicella aurantiaca TaxID=591202 RepID=A0A316DKQ0_9BACT|nr:outer membrane beta-barrel protein [Arcicella aurantiaca]PWK18082.1 outer membrane receptor protein involved in Fe transport [Arcicella aurantiaca]